MKIRKLTEPQVSRLKPFFSNRTDKTRACFYLLAVGFKPGEISEISGDDFIRLASADYPKSVKPIFETLSIMIADEGTHDDYFFATPAGRRYTGASISKMLREACIKVGIPYQGYHRFSHYILNGKD